MEKKNDNIFNNKDIQLLKNAVREAYELFEDSKQKGIHIKLNK